MSEIYLRQSAKHDIVEHFAYLVDNAGISVADRFLQKTQMSFDSLALTPLMGSPVALRDPRLAGMRKWRVESFDNMLIFYIPRPTIISVVRVLHAAQDWWRLLGFIE